MLFLNDVRCGSFEELLEVREREAAVRALERADEDLRRRAGTGRAIA